MWTKVKTKTSVIELLCFSAHVLCGSVYESLESGGVGEERSGQFHHPLTADYNENQGGERTGEWRRRREKDDGAHFYGCLFHTLSLLLFVFRFRSSVSTSWSFLSPSCSRPLCSRYSMIDEQPFTLTFTPLVNLLWTINHVFEAVVLRENSQWESTVVQDDHQSGC